MIILPDNESGVEIESFTSQKYIVIIGLDHVEYLIASYAERVSLRAREENMKKRDSNA